MTAEEIKLLEEFIDLKLRRVIAGTEITLFEHKPEEILHKMFPIELRLEELRQQLIKK